MSGKRDLHRQPIDVCFPDNNGPGRGDERCHAKRTQHIDWCGTWSHVVLL